MCEWRRSPLTGIKLQNVVTWYLWGSKMDQFWYINFQPQTKTAVRVIREFQFPVSRAEVYRVKLNLNIHIVHKLRDKRRVCRKPTRADNFAVGMIINNYYTFNTLTLFWLAESICWILEISARDVITANYTIIISRTLKVTGYHIKY